MREKLKLFQREKRVYFKEKREAANVFTCHVDVLFI